MPKKNREPPAELTGKYVAIEDAVDWITPKVERDDSTEAKKRVRNIIDYARRTKNRDGRQLVDRNVGRPELEGDSFRAWAIQQWPVLTEWLVVSFRAAGQAGNYDDPRFVATNPPPIPDTLEACQDELAKTRVKVTKLEQEKHDLQKLNERQEEELRKFRAWREKQRRFGKQGGRGKEK